MGLLKSNTYFRAFSTSFIPVSLFDLESRFFAPTRSIAKPARAGAVKVGRGPNLTAYSGLPGHTLTASSTPARLMRSGRRSEGSLPWGANHRAATLYSVGPCGPDHDAVMRIGGEAPKRRVHSPLRLESHAFARRAATSDRHRAPAIAT